mgnify:CR=1 FL=1
MMKRPEFAGSLCSGSKRIVAPSLPPVSAAASYVPDACHATRIAIGHAFTLRLMRAE